MRAAAGSISWWRRTRRLATFALLLALLGLTVPDAGRSEAQFTLIKLDSVSGLDAADDVVWILALGSDARPGEPVLGSRTDAIQLVGINTQTHTGVTIGVPRDSYVEIPGVGSDKINAAMVYGGPEATAGAVAALTDITPDYVFVTSFKGLKRMVDGVGGVKAKVTYEMDDMGHVFHPGVRTFDGEEALAFARIRHGIPRGDFDRSMDQGQLLRGGLATVLGKLDQPGFYEKSLGLFARQTDANVNPVDLYRLGRAVLAVDPGKVTVCVLNGGVGYVGEASVVFPDRAAAAALSDDVRHDAKVNDGC